MKLGRDDCVVKLISTMVPLTPVTKRLDETEFLDAFVAPMRDVTNFAEPSLDIWPYALSVPSADLAGHERWEPFVESVYRLRRQSFRPCSCLYHDVRRISRSGGGPHSERNHRTSPS